MTTFTYDITNRLIKIPSSYGDTLNVQDLLDDIRDFEDDPVSMGLDHLAEASGKEDLSSTVTVGITLKLINWKVQFIDRGSCPCASWTACEVTGGNLVAVDANDVFINPIEPSDCVNVTRTTSASATIASLEIDNLQRLIETQRDTHTGTGDIYYWDPSAGNDGYVGNSPDYPKKTFAAVHALATDYNHDIIICQPGDNTGPTYTTEALEITKNYLFLRGPGYDFRISSNTAGEPSIKVRADGVEIDSLYIQNGPLATAGIDISGCSDTLVKACNIDTVTDIGVNIINSERPYINNLTISNSGGDGIKIGSSVEHLDMKNVHVHDAGGDGITFDGFGTTHCKVRGKGTSLHDNSGYGLYIGSGCSDLLLDIEGTVQNNTLGNILDSGTNTHYTGLDHTAAFAGFVHIDTNGGGIPGTQYPRGTPNTPVDNITDARTIADGLGVRAYRLRGEMILNSNYDDWLFEGWTSIRNDKITLNGQSVDKSQFYQIELSGSMIGTDVNYKDCILNYVSGAHGIAVGCGMMGTITLAGIATYVLIKDCSLSDSPVVFDMVGVGRILKASTGGDIKIINMGAASQLQLGMSHGSIELDSTCVGGSANLRGNASLTDNSSGVSITNNLFQNVTSDAVWDEVMSTHTTAGTMGSGLRFITNIEGGKWYRSGNQMIFYNSGGTSEIARFNLYGSGGALAGEQEAVYMRARV